MTELVLEDLKNFVGAMSDKEVPVEINIHIYVGGVEPGGGGVGSDNGDEVTVQPSKPDTVLIDMTSREAYKYTRNNNDAGFPIMEGLKVGFKALESDRLEVYFPAIVADGGDKYYRIWSDGEGGDIEQGYPLAGSGQRLVPVYVNKGRTIRV